MPRLTVSHALVPSYSRIEDPEERRFYWERLAALWRVPPRRAKLPTYFPGCNPVSLNRAQHLPALRASRYLVALKSDGVRYALLLTVRQDGVSPVALMVDRSRTMYEVEVLAPEDYFLRGTVLEGELVWRQPEEMQMLYLVFDAVCIKGDSLLDTPFEERLQRAAACTRFSENLDDDAEARVLETDSLALVHFTPSLAMRPKHFVAREHVARLWSERADSAHRVDGVVFQRANAPYAFGTAEGLEVLKWKPESTIDLVGPADALRCADGPVAEALDGRRAVVLASRVHAADDVVVEYHVQQVLKDEVWLFAVRTRPDKTSGNGLRVVRAAVQEAREQTTPSDLAT